MAFILDDTIKLNIGDFSKWGYLSPDNPKSGTIKFFFDEVLGFEIRVVTNHLKNCQSLVVEFTLDELIHTQVLHVVYLHSNLGKGYVPYFLCPKENGLCRKLFLYGNSFIGRSAIPKSIYQSQCTNKSIRYLQQHLEKIRRIDSYNELLNKKYFKYTYSKKKTKIYRKILRELKM